MRLRGQLKSSELYKPLVSVITVVKNLVAHGRETLFRQMMESVWRQTYGSQHIEHIIIDGGSQDGTVNLIQYYDDLAGIDYWRSAPDSGIYPAMNIGARMAKGDIINYLNSDDYFTPEAIQISVDALLQENADYSHGLTPYLLEDGTTWYIAGQQLSWNNVYFGMPIGHASLFIKRECLWEMGLFAEDYTILSDYLLVLNLYLKGKRRASFHEVTAYFRHFDGKSSNPETLRIEFQEHFRNFAPRLGLGYEQFSIFLIKANPFLGEILGISSLKTVNRDDKRFLLSSLSGLSQCKHLNLALDFQKCFIITFIHQGGFRKRRSIRARIFKYVYIVFSLFSLNCSHLSRSDFQMLTSFPFIEITGDLIIRINDIFANIAAVNNRKKLLKLQQMLILDMFHAHEAT